MSEVKTLVLVSFYGGLDQSYFVATADRCRAIQSVLKRLHDVHQPQEMHDLASLKAFRVAVVDPDVVEVPAI